MITEIAYFAFPVKDMAQARSFYEGILGLKVAANFRDEWIEYDIKETTFAITTMEMQRTPGAKGGVIAFEVDDFEKTITDLKTKQVKFAFESFETPVCHMAIAIDPDGNEFLIHKRKS